MADRLMGRAADVGEGSAGLLSERARNQVGVEARRIPDHQGMDEIRSEGQDGCAGDIPRTVNDWGMVTSPATALLFPEGGIAVG